MSSFLLKFVFARHCMQCCGWYNFYTLAGSSVYHFLFLVLGSHDRVVPEKEGEQIHVDEKLKGWGSPWHSLELSM